MAVAAQTAVTHAPTTIALKRRAERPAGTAESLIFPLTCRPTLSYHLGANRLAGIFRGILACDSRSRSVGSGTWTICSRFFCFFLGEFFHDTLHRTRLTEGDRATRRRVPSVSRCPRVRKIVVPDALNRPRRLFENFEHPSCFGCLLALSLGDLPVLGDVEDRIYHVVLGLVEKF